MNSIIQKKNNDYTQLLDSVGKLLEKSRKGVFYRINQTLVKTYWEIGRIIVEFEQKGEEKAEYGSKLLDKLSQDLKLRYGKGFSRSNTYLMRLFFIKYHKIQTVSGKLSWSHYCELLNVSNDLGKSFYEKQCLKEKWSVRELSRQINSMLFERLALGKDKQKVLALSTCGQSLSSPEDMVKDPYVFEFLGIPQGSEFTEKEFEQKIIDNLQMFLLELGKGFAFVARQYRLTLNQQHFYVDLVFYHRVLKCFVLIDLKIGKVNHNDIGQMNLYLNYFKREEMSEGDGEPIGIILAAEKNHFFVEYALGGISNQLFVSKYKLYLPSKEELEREIRKLI
ncbi:MAG TPA: PDDEXK nuclease domain-containing protein [Candidatus Nanoarchaeia archaeon]|nr:PDDEXK nuclease domain-containing protein [Candidatus Nanoarchaeia archaeon]